MHDKLLVLAGPKPKRLRLRVDGSEIVQTTWNAKGQPKVARKAYADDDAAKAAFDKAVRKRLRDDYVVMGEGHEPGDLVFEAFAPGGGGGAVLDMSRDGKRIVTATITSESMFGSKVEVVEVASGARRILAEHAGGGDQQFLLAALFDRDGSAIYYVLNQDTYRVDLATGTRTQVAAGRDRELNHHVVRPSFDAARERLVVFATGPIVRVLGVDAQVLLEVTPPRECRGARLSPSGRLLAILLAGDPSEVQIWDVDSASHWETLTTAKLHHLGLTPEDDALIVTRDYARGPVALEIPSGRELWSLAGEDTYTFGWAYSPDGSRLAIAGNSLQILDARTRRVELDLVARAYRTACPVFSSDGRRLAASIDGSGKIYAV